MAASQDEIRLKDPTNFITCSFSCLTDPLTGIKTYRMNSWMEKRLVGSKTWTPTGDMVTSLSAEVWTSLSEQRKILFAAGYEVGGPALPAELAGYFSEAKNVLTDYHSDGGENLTEFLMLKDIQPAPHTEAWAPYIERWMTEAPWRERVEEERRSARTAEAHARSSHNADRWSSVESPDR